MREILFRGKLLSDGRWAEGNLDIKKSGVCIITPDETPVGCYGQVDPETVGQYTGLTDKNGKQIFEGDVVKGFNTFHGREERYIVCYKEIGFFFCENANEWHPDHLEEKTVIGNIHDNPEMIGGAEDGK